MNLQTVNSDIKKLESALTLVQQTDNYLHFAKSTIIFDLCEQINVLREKRDNQIMYLEKLKINLRGK